MVTQTHLRVKHYFLLLAAIAIAYVNSFTGALVFDSGALTVEDKRVTGPDISAILTTNYWGGRFDSGLYRPATTLTYAADYAVHGERIAGYHVANFLLHAVAVLLGYGVLRVVSPAIAFPAALLWAVHPLNTEAVTNVAGRPDLLAAVFVFAGFLLYQRRWLVPLAIVAALGMFSKESAVLLLPMVLLHDAWLRQRSYAAGIVAISVPAVGILAIHAAMPMLRPFVDNPLVAAGWWTRHMMALRVMGRLLGLWFWPATLSADYSYNQIPLTATVPLAGVLLALALAAAIWRWKTPTAFWTLLALGAMLPTSNLLVTSGSIMAERFLYIPGLALSALAVLAIRAGLHNRRAATAVIISAAVALAIRTQVRNQDYRDDLTFWRATAQASPNSFKAQSQYAMELAGRGQVQEAAARADRIVSILSPIEDRNNVWLSWTQAATYYKAVGRTADARLAGERVAAIMNAAERKGSK